MVEVFTASTLSVLSGVCQLGLKLEKTFLSLDALI